MSLSVAEHTIWLGHPEWPRYLFSPEGGVLSLMGKKPMLLNFSPTPKGYVLITLHKNGKKHRMLFHRVIAEVFCENSENKPQVNHKNGIKNDNRSSNLEWVTSKENHHHARCVLNRGFAKGSEKSDIPDDTIRLALKLRYFSNKKMKEISEELGLPISTLSGVFSGKTWKHIFKEMNIQKMKRHSTRLSLDDIKYIRETAKPELRNYGVVAEKFKITRSLVYNIVKNKIYKEVGVT